MLIEQEIKLVYFRIRLEEEAEELSKVDSDLNAERLMDVYERLDELDASTAETKAARILHGLGNGHLNVLTPLVYSLVRFLTRDATQEMFRFFRWMEDEGFARSGSLCEATPTPTGRTNQSS